MGFGHFAFILFCLRPDWEGVQMNRISDLRALACSKYRHFWKKLKHYLRLVLLILVIIKRIVDLIQ